MTLAEEIELLKVDDEVVYMQLAGGTVYVHKNYGHMGLTEGTVNICLTGVMECIWLNVKNQSTLHNFLS